MTTYPDDYNALCARLGLDLEDLDNELMKMPPLVQEAAELAAIAMNDENACHLALDIIKAEVGLQLRQEQEKITEAAIERLLPLSVEVQEARSNYNHAKTYAGLCGDLVRSLRTKSSLLQKACEMTVAGFITPSAAYERRRAAMNAARQEAKSE
jgi:hypothetical protein